jgi:hypothetical protein
MDGFAKKSEGELDTEERQYRNIYKVGAIATVIALLGIILDIVAGNITGGNLTALPQTAVDRFAQFQGNWLTGLYNLDMLNVLIQLTMLLVYFALYAAHRKADAVFSGLAVLVFVVGTILFVANNAALSMFDLSSKYYGAATDAQKNLYAVAGEAMLAKGTHGSLSAFIGFILPSLANIIMSFVMLRGKVFSRLNSYLGIAGSFFISIYLVLVTFVPETKSAATAISMPGGILLLVWMIMFTGKFFALGFSKKTLGDI